MTTTSNRYTRCFDKLYYPFVAGGGLTGLLRDLKQILTYEKSYVADATDYCSSHHKALIYHLKMRAKDSRFLNLSGYCHTVIISKTRHHLR